MSWETELDILNGKVRDARERIENIESKIAALDEKAAAAKELLAEAERVLAEVPQPGVTSAAWCDKRDAEALLARIAEERPVLEEALKGARSYLAQVKERKHQFPMKELERERKLARLRQACR